MHPLYKARQYQIISKLNVRNNIDIDYEINSRVQFLAYYLRQSNASGLVLGISGGVDSSVAGMMAQMACKQLRDQKHFCTFTAVRLPYGEQRDEDQAQRVLSIIQPDQVVTVDIKGATDAMLAALGPSDDAPAQIDFVKGNIKARQRMIAQYALAGQRGALVVGTDHAAEALMGFFTKFGDGGADILPLSGLMKNQVQDLAVALGFPLELAYKTPTADLEDLDPGKPDESAFGITYHQINAFLSGEDLPDAVCKVIIDQYDKTQHKRDQPVAP